MSSTLRAKAVKIGKDTNKFDNISTPCYPDAGLDYDAPIPFTVNNGVLDINITNTSVQAFIDNGNYPGDDSEFQAKFMGGIRLIHTLGPNLRTYLRNRINANEETTYTGPIDLVIAPVMTKVQIAQPGQVQGLTFENVYGVNDFPPTSDEYVGGSASNNYYASWVFKNPMTVRYEASGSPTGYRYMTFSTHYDGD